MCCKKMYPASYFLTVFTDDVSGCRPHSAVFGAEGALLDAVPAGRVRILLDVAYPID
jgi:hypothetical protein